MRKYRIGEIARLAGVSKRTIDYYTTLGLLNPVRSENNYRYYGTETLVRLKIIESLKMSRFTLEEIRDQLMFLDQRDADAACATGGRITDVELLRRQLKQLEQQLLQLRPGSVAALNEVEAVRLRNKVMLQSLAVFQSLMLYINEFAVHI